MAVSEQQLMDALKAVIDPNTGRDFVSSRVIKNFAITERWKLQFRAETFNLANYANLSNPNTTVTSGAFGTITGQDPPRSWQGALKLTF